MAEEQARGKRPFDNDGKKDNFYMPKLKAGQSKQVRFITDFKDFAQAWRHDFVKVNAVGDIIVEKVPTKADKDKGERYAGSFTCLSAPDEYNSGKEITCPLCKAGLPQARPKFGAIVIDRESGKAKFFEHDSKSIYHLLRKEYDTNGTLLNVDYKISREGSGKNDTRYAVNPIISTASKPITEEEKKLAEEIKIGEVYKEKTVQEIDDAIKGKKKEGETSGEEEATPF